MMCFKILSGKCPAYLSDIITPKVRARSTRTTNTRELERMDNRSTTKSYGFRAFTIGAPILWNSLPSQIRTELNINRFKTQLKTYLFKKHFTH